MVKIYKIFIVKHSKICQVVILHKISGKNLKIFIKNYHLTNLSNYDKIEVSGVDLGLRPAALTI